ncbi:MAG TPA: substrate-binding domain-containing protein [Streptosporangiaceae bacterium]|nr:substrate-binding domain-containing protein [Streptosporangiaceae bacterium]
MRIITKLLTGACAVATVMVVTAGPALADPPSGVTPKPNDVVGVGAQTTQFLYDQISHDYNAAVTSTTAPRFYYFDAVNPTTGQTGDPIVTKSGCASIPRPNGSSQGITALTTSNGTTSGHHCIDFAGSSRDRSSTDPTSVSFVDLAGDAVTYATQKTTNAPTNLTTADLTAIYNCTVTNWNQVGGQNAPIHPFIPQSGSGTRTFFLAAIGVPSPGACVSDGGGTLEENEGVNPLLNDPDAIFPYSVADYIAEGYHSAKCLNSACTPVNGQVCQPAGTQNLFGCDENGTLRVQEINSTPPTTPWPLTPTSKGPVINTGFSPAFLRTLFEVVSGPETGGVGTIPSYLQKFFGPHGYLCNNLKAKTDLKHYGFVVLPAGTAPGDCGSAH